MRLVDCRIDWRVNCSAPNRFSPNDWPSSLPCSFYKEVPFSSCFVQTLRRSLELLKNIYGRVFFVPGNHELWCKQKDEPQDSLEKLSAVLDLCESLGVETSPGTFGDTIIVPVLSWYHRVTPRCPQYSTLLWSSSVLRFLLSSSLLHFPYVLWRSFSA